MKKTLLIILLISLCFLGNSETISLEQAKSLALQNNPEFLAKKFAYESAKWSSVKAFSALFPSAKISASELQLKPGTPKLSPNGMPVFSDETNTRSYGYSVNQPLFYGGKLWFAYKISADAKKIAEFDYRYQKLKTFAAVEEKYLNLLEAEELLQIARQQLRSASENLKIAEVKFQIGSISKTELLKFQAEKATKESELIRAKRMRQLSFSDLKNFLQLSNSFEIEKISENLYADFIKIADELSQSKIDEILGKVVEYGEQNNLSLKSLEQAKKMSARSVRIASGNFLPTLNLTYSRTWSKNWNENQTAQDADYEDSKQIMLSASVPVFPFFDNFAALKKAKYDLKKTEKDFITAKSGIDTALENGFLNLINSAKDFKASELSLRYSEELFRQLQEKFQQGLISANELLDANLMLKSASVNKTKSFYNFIKAKTELMQLLGFEEEENLLNLMK